MNVIQPQEQKLALYHYLGCPYCSIAREPFERLGIEVELRDIQTNPQHRKDLINARGRGTVPVLRIMSSGVKDQWLPESRDIIRYIEKNY